MKTIACVLMVLAHARTYGRTEDIGLTILFWQGGFFAPVLFMAAMGWGLVYQMRKRTKRELVLFYLILLGTTVMWFGTKGSYPVLYGGLFFSLALSAIICVAFPRASLQPWFLPLPIVAYFVAQYSGVPPTPFTSGIFSLLPWMYFVLLGRYLYAHPRQAGYALAGALPVAVALYLAGMRIDSKSGADYLLFLALGTTAYCLCLLLISRSHVLVKLRFVAWLGRGTLSFLFVHLIFTRALRALSLTLPAPLMWLLIFGASIALLWVLQYLNRRTLHHVAQSPWFWAIMIAAEAAPLRGGWATGTALAAFSWVWLLVFSLNYPGLFGAMRRVRWLKIPSGVAAPRRDASEPIEVP